jgi:hypothetical protein
MTNPAVDALMAARPRARNDPRCKGRPCGIHMVVVVTVRRPSLRGAARAQQTVGAASRVGIGMALPRIPRAGARRRRLPSDLEAARQALDEIDESKPRASVRLPGPFGVPCAVTPG